jgi:hypothetical protein
MVHSPSLDPDISPALRFSDRIAHKPNPLI